MLGAIGGVLIGISTTVLVLSGPGEWSLCMIAGFICLGFQAGMDNK